MVVEGFSYSDGANYNEHFASALKGGLNRTDKPTVSFSSASGNPISPASIAVDEFMNLSFGVAVSPGVEVSVEVYRDGVFCQDESTGGASSSITGNAKYSVKVPDFNKQCELIIRYTKDNEVLTQQNLKGDSLRNSLDLGPNIDSFMSLTKPSVEIVDGAVVVGANFSANIFSSWNVFRNGELVQNASITDDGKFIVPVAAEEDASIYKEGSWEIVASYNGSISTDVLGKYVSEKDAEKIFEYMQDKGLLENDNGELFVSAKFFTTKARNELAKFLLKMNSFGKDVSRGRFVRFLHNASNLKNNYSWNFYPQQSLIRTTSENNILRLEDGAGNLSFQITEPGTVELLDANGEQVTSRTSDISTSYIHLDIDLTAAQIEKGFVDVKFSSSVSEEVRTRRLDIVSSKNHNSAGTLSTKDFASFYSFDADNKVPGFHLCRLENQALNRDEQVVLYVQENMEAFEQIRESISDGKSLSKQQLLFLMDFLTESGFNVPCSVDVEALAADAESYLFSGTLNHQAIYNYLAGDIDVDQMETELNKTQVDLKKAKVAVSKCSVQLEHIFSSQNVLSLRKFLFSKFDKEDFSFSSTTAVQSFVKQFEANFKDIHKEISVLDLSKFTSFEKYMKENNVDFKEMNESVFLDQMNSYLNENKEMLLKNPMLMLSVKAALKMDSVLPEGHYEVLVKISEHIKKQALSIINEESRNLIAEILKITLTDNAIYMSDYLRARDNSFGSVFTGEGLKTLELEKFGDILDIMKNNKVPSSDSQYIKVLIERLVFPERFVFNKELNSFGISFSYSDLSQSDAGNKAVDQRHNIFDCWDFQSHEDVSFGKANDYRSVFMYSEFDNQLKEQGGDSKKNLSGDNNAQFLKEYKMLAKIVGVYSGEGGEINDALINLLKIPKRKYTVALIDQRLLDPTVTDYEKRSLIEVKKQMLEKSVNVADRMKSYQDGADGDIRKNFINTFRRYVKDNGIDLWAKLLINTGVNEHYADKAAEVGLSLNDYYNEYFTSKSFSSINQFVAQDTGVTYDQLLGIIKELTAGVQGDKQILNKEQIKRVSDKKGSVEFADITLNTNELYSKPIALLNFYAQSSKGINSSEVYIPNQISSEDLLKILSQNFISGGDWPADVQKAAVKLWNSNIPKLIENVSATPELKEFYVLVADKLQTISFVEQNLYVKADSGGAKKLAYISQTLVGASVSSRSRIDAEIQDNSSLMSMKMLYLTDTGATDENGQPIAKMFSDKMKAYRNGDASAATDLTKFLKDIPVEETSLGFTKWFFTKFCGDKLSLKAGNGAELVFTTFLNTSKEFKIDGKIYELSDLHGLVKSALAKLEDPEAEFSDEEKTVLQGAMIMFLVNMDMKAVAKGLLSGDDVDLKEHFSPFLLAFKSKISGLVDIFPGRDVPDLEDGIAKLSKGIFEKLGFQKAASFADSMDEKPASLSNNLKKELISTIQKDNDLFLYATTTDMSLQKDDMNVQLVDLAVNFIKERLESVSDDKLGALSRETIEEALQQWPKVRASFGDEAFNISMDSIRENPTHTYVLKLMQIMGVVKHQNIDITRVIVFEGTDPTKVIVGKPDSMARAGSKALSLAKDWYMPAPLRQRKFGSLDYYAGAINGLNEKLPESIRFPMMEEGGISRELGGYGTTLADNLLTGVVGVDINFLFMNYYFGLTFPAQTFANLFNDDPSVQEHFDDQLTALNKYLDDSVFTKDTLVQILGDDTKSDAIYAELIRTKIIDKGGFVQGANQSVMRNISVAIGLDPKESAIRSVLSKFNLDEKQLTTILNTLMDSYKQDLDLNSEVKFSALESGGKLLDGLVDVHIGFYMFRNNVWMMLGTMGFFDDLEDGDLLSAYMKFAVVNYYSLPGKDQSFWDSRWGRTVNAPMRHFLYTPLHLAAKKLSDNQGLIDFTRQLKEKGGTGMLFDKFVGQQINKISDEIIKTEEQIRQSKDEINSIEAKIAKLKGKPDSAEELTALRAQIDQIKVGKLKKLMVGLVNASKTLAFLSNPRARIEEALSDKVLNEIMQKEEVKLKSLEEFKSLTLSEKNKRFSEYLAKIINEYKDIPNSKKREMFSDSTLKKLYQLQQLRDKTIATLRKGPNWLVSKPVQLATASMRRSALLMEAMNASNKDLLAIKSNYQELDKASKASLSNTRHQDIKTTEVTRGQMIMTQTKNGGFDFVQLAEESSKKLLPKNRMPQINNLKRLTSIVADQFGADNDRFVKDANGQLWVSVNATDGLGFVKEEPLLVDRVIVDRNMSASEYQEGIRIVRTRDHTNQAFYKTDIYVNPAFLGLGDEALETAVQKALTSQETLLSKTSVVLDEKDSGAQFKVEGFDAKSGLASVAKSFDDVANKADEARETLEPSESLIKYSLSDVLINNTSEDALKLLNGGMTKSQFQSFMYYCRNNNVQNINRDMVASFIAEERFIGIPVVDYRMASEYIQTKTTEMLNESFKNIVADDYVGAKGQYLARQGDSEDNSIRNKLASEKELAGISDDINEKFVGDQAKVTEIMTKANLPIYMEAKAEAFRAFYDLYIELGGDKAVVDELAKSGNVKGIEGALQSLLKGLDAGGKSKAIAVADGYSALIGSRESIAGSNTLIGKIRDELKTPGDDPIDIDKLKGSKYYTDYKRMVLRSWILRWAQANDFQQKPFYNQAMFQFLSLADKNVAENMGAGGGKTETLTGVCVARVLLGYNVALVVSNKKDAKSGFVKTIELLRLSGIKSALYQKNEGDAAKKGKFDHSKTQVLYIDNSDLKFQNLGDILKIVNAVFPTDAKKRLQLVIDEFDKNYYIDGADPTIMSKSMNDKMTNKQAMPYKIGITAFEKFIEKHVDDSKYVNKSNSGFTREGVLKFREFLDAELKNHSFKGSMGKADAYSRVMQLSGRILNVYLNIHEGIDYKFFAGEQGLIDFSQKRINWGSVNEDRPIVEAFHIFGKRSRFADLKKLTQPSPSSIPITQIGFAKRYAAGMFGTSATVVDFTPELAREFIMVMAIEENIQRTLEEKPHIMCENKEVQLLKVTDTCLRNLVAGAPVLAHTPFTASNAAANDTQITLEEVEQNMNKFMDLMEYKILMEKVNGTNVKPLTSKEKSRLSVLEKSGIATDSNVLNMYEKLGGEGYLKQYQKLLDYNSKLVGHYVAASKLKGKLKVEIPEFLKNYNYSRLHMASIRQGEAVDSEIDKILAFGCGLATVLLSTSTNRAVDVQSKSDYLGTLLASGVISKKEYEKMRADYGFKDIGAVGIMTQYKSDVAFWIQEAFRLGRTSGPDSREQGSVYNILSADDTALQNDPALKHLLLHGTALQKAGVVIMKSGLLPPGSKLRLDIGEMKADYRSLGVFDKYRSLPIASAIYSMETAENELVKLIRKDMKAAVDFCDKYGIDLKEFVGGINGEGSATKSFLTCIAREGFEKFCGEKGIDAKFVFNYMEAKSISQLLDMDIKEVLRPNGQIIEIKGVNDEETKTLFAKTSASLQKIHRDGIAAKKEGQDASEKTGLIIEKTLDLFRSYKSQKKPKRVRGVGEQKLVQSSYKSLPLSEIGEVKDIPTLMTMMFESSLEAVTRSFELKNGIDNLDKILANPDTPENKKIIESYIKEIAKSTGVKIDVNAFLVKGITHKALVKEYLSRYVYKQIHDTTAEKPGAIEPVLETIVKRLEVIQNLYGESDDVIKEMQGLQKMIGGSEVDIADKLQGASPEFIFRALSLSMWETHGLADKLVSNSGKGLAWFFVFTQGMGQQKDEYRTKSGEELKQKEQVVREEAAKPLLGPQGKGCKFDNDLGFTKFDILAVVLKDSISSFSLNDESTKNIHINIGDGDKEYDISKPEVLKDVNQLLAKNINVDGERLMIIAVDDHFILAQGTVEEMSSEERLVYLNKIHYAPGDRVDFYGAVFNNKGARLGDSEKFEVMLTEENIKNYFEKLLDQASDKGAVSEEGKYARYALDLLEISKNLTDKDPGYKAAKSLLMKTIARLVLSHEEGHIHHLKNDEMFKDLPQTVKDESYTKEVFEVYADFSKEGLLGQIAKGLKTGGDSAKESMVLLSVLLNMNAKDKDGVNSKILAIVGDIDEYVKAQKEGDVAKVQQLGEELDKLSTWVQKEISEYVKTIGNMNVANKLDASMLNALTQQLKNRLGIKEVYEHVGKGVRDSSSALTAVSKMGAGSDHKERIAEDGTKVFDISTKNGSHTAMEAIKALKSLQAGEKFEVSISSPYIMNISVEGSDLKNAKEIMQSTNAFQKQIQDIFVGSPAMKDVPNSEVSKLVLQVLSELADYKGRPVADIIKEYPMLKAISADGFVSFRQSMHQLDVVYSKIYEGAIKDKNNTAGVAKIDKTFVYNKITEQLKSFSGNFGQKVFGFQLSFGEMRGSADEVLKVIAENPYLFSGGSKSHLNSNVERINKVEGYRLGESIMAGKLGSEELLAISRDSGVNAARNQLSGRMSPTGIKTTFGLYAKNGDIADYKNFSVEEVTTAAKSVMNKMLASPGDWSEGLLKEYVGEVVSKELGIDPKNPANKEIIEYFEKSIFNGDEYKVANELKSIGMDNPKVMTDMIKFFQTNGEFAKSASKYAVDDPRMVDIVRKGVSQFMRKQFGDKQLADYSKWFDSNGNLKPEHYDKVSKLFIKGSFSKAVGRDVGENAFQCLVVVGVVALIRQSKGEDPWSEDTLRYAWNELVATSNLVKRTAFSFLFDFRTVNSMMPLVATVGHSMVKATVNNEENLVRSMADYRLKQELTFQRKNIFDEHVHSLKQQQVSAVEYAANGTFSLSAGEQVYTFAEINTDVESMRDMMKNGEQYNTAFDAVFLGSDLFEVDKMNKLLASNYLLETANGEYVVSPKFVDDMKNNAFPYDSFFTANEKKTLKDSSMAYNVIFQTAVNQWTNESIPEATIITDLKQKYHVSVADIDDEKMYEYIQLNTQNLVLEGMVIKSKQLGLDAEIKDNSTLMGLIMCEESDFTAQVTIAGFSQEVVSKLGNLRAEYSLSLDKITTLLEDYSFAKSKVYALCQSIGLLTGVCKPVEAEEYFKNKAVLHVLQEKMVDIKWEAKYTPPSDKSVTAYFNNQIAINNIDDQSYVSVMMSIGELVAEYLKTGESEAFSMYLRQNVASFEKYSIQTDIEELCRDIKKYEIADGIKSQANAPLEVLVYFESEVEDIMSKNYDSILSNLKDMHGEDLSLGRNTLSSIAMLTTFMLSKKYASAMLPGSKSVVKLGRGANHLTSMSIASLACIASNLALEWAHNQDIPGFRSTMENTLAPFMNELKGIGYMMPSSFLDRFIKDKFGASYSTFIQNRYEDDSTKLWGATAGAELGMALFDVGVMLGTVEVGKKIGVMEKNPGVKYGRHSGVKSVEHYLDNAVGGKGTKGVSSMDDIIKIAKEKGMAVEKTANGKITLDGKKFSVKAAAKHLQVASYTDDQIDGILKYLNNNLGDDVSGAARVPGSSKIKLSYKDGRAAKVVNVDQIEDVVRHHSKVTAISEVEKLLGKNQKFKITTSQKTGKISIKFKNGDVIDDLSRAQFDDALSKRKGLVWDTFFNKENKAASGKAWATLMGVLTLLSIAEQAATNGGEIDWSKVSKDAFKGAGVITAFAITEKAVSNVKWLGSTTAASAGKWSCAFSRSTVVASLLVELGMSVAENGSDLFDSNASSATRNRAGGEIAYDVAKAGLAGFASVYAVGAMGGAPGLVVVVVGTVVYVLVDYVIDNIRDQFFDELIEEAHTQGMFYEKAGVEVVYEEENRPKSAKKEIKARKIENKQLRAYIARKDVYNRLKEAKIQKITTGSIYDLNPQIIEQILTEVSSLKAERVLNVEVQFVAENKDNEAHNIIYELVVKDPLNERILLTKKIYNKKGIKVNFSNSREAIMHDGMLQTANGSQLGVSVRSDGFNALMTNNNGTKPSDLAVQLLMQSYNNEKLSKDYIINNFGADFYEKLQNDNFYINLIKALKTGKAIAVNAAMTKSSRRSSYSAGPGGISSFTYSVHPKTYQLLEKLYQEFLDDHYDSETIDDKLSRYNILDLEKGYSVLVQNNNDEVSGVDSLSPVEQAKYLAYVGELIEQKVLFGSVDAYKEGDKFRSIYIQFVYFPYDTAKLKDGVYEHGIMLRDVYTSAMHRNKMERFGKWNIEKLYNSFSYEQKEDFAKYIMNRNDVYVRDTGGLLFPSKYYPIGTYSKGSGYNYFNMPEKRKDTLDDGLYYKYSETEESGILSFYHERLQPTLSGSYIRSWEERKNPAINLESLVYHDKKGLFCVKDNNGEWAKKDIQDVLFDYIAQAEMKDAVTPEDMFLIRENATIYSRFDDSCYDKYGALKMHVVINNLSPVEKNEYEKFLSTKEGKKLVVSKYPTKIGNEAAFKEFMRVSAIRKLEVQTLDKTDFKTAFQVMTDGEKLELLKEMEDSGNSFLKNELGLTANNLESYFSLSYELGQLDIQLNLAVSKGNNVKKLLILHKMLTKGRDDVFQDFMDTYKLVCSSYVTKLSSLNQLELDEESFELIEDMFGENFPELAKQEKTGRRIVAKVIRDVKQYVNQGDFPDDITLEQFKIHLNNGDSEGKYQLDSIAVMLFVLDNGLSNISLLNERTLRVMTLEDEDAREDRMNLISSMNDEEAAEYLPEEIARLLSIFEKKGETYINVFYELDRKNDLIHRFEMLNYMINRLIGADFSLYETYQSRFQRVIFDVSLMTESKKDKVITAKLSGLLDAAKMKEAFVWWKLFDDLGYLEQVKYKLEDVDRSDKSDIVSIINDYRERKASGGVSEKEFAELFERTEMKMSSTPTMLRGMAGISSYISYPVKIDLKRYMYRIMFECKHDFQDRLAVENWADIDLVMLKDVYNDLSMEREAYEFLSKTGTTVESYIERIYLIESLAEKGFIIDKDDVVFVYSELAKLIKTTSAEALAYISDSQEVNQLRAAVAVDKDADVSLLLQDDNLKDKFAQIGGEMYAKRRGIALQHYAATLLAEK